MRMSVSVAQLVERDRPPGERVPGRAGEDHLVREERLEAHTAMPTRGADDAELELARGDALDDRVRVRDGEEHAHVRVLTLELPEHDRDRDRSRPGRRAEDEVARELALARRGDLGDELILEREHPLRAAVEPPARLGRLDAAPGAVEELRPEPLLERAHLQRDGRLRHAEALGGLREAPALDDRAERGELTRVHKRILSVGQKTPRSASQCSSSGSVSSGPASVIRTSALPMSPRQRAADASRRSPRKRSVSSAYRCAATRRGRR